MKHLVLASMFGSLLACNAADSLPDATKTVEATTKPGREPGPAEVAPAKLEPAKPDPATPEPAKPGPANSDPATPDPAPPDPAPPTPANLEPPVEPTPAGAASTAEVPIKPWTAHSLGATWRPIAEPGEPLSLVDLNAGVLARAGTKWLQRGDGDTLVPLEMDREPQLPVLGTWPSDAWFVETRWKKYGPGEDADAYLELRLMKLRNGTRWAPQVYSGTGEQWFHPGTDHWEQTHISALSGLLVYTDEFTRITRVAGRYPDPTIGPHRGDVIGFLETGAAKVDVLSSSPEGIFVQVDCEDDACVSAHAMKLPLPEWSFGRSVTRGRHAVSVLATACQARSDAGTRCDPASTRDFILHNHGKPDAWVLEELPAGERPTGLWSSAAGGLWTLAGERLRWRDTNGVWHDVALPAGLVQPSIALTEDRTQVWVAGQLAGAPRVFATSANTPAP